MKPFLNLVIVLISGLFYVPCHAQTDILRLAVTTTAENAGLMAQLTPVFETQYGVKINAVTSGSAQVLRLGKQGNVDVLLTHAPELEVQFIESGFGINRTAVMHNDFILIGPVADPANINASVSIRDAFNRLNNKKHPFISRGDGSGTHAKELAIWQENTVVPEGEWYIEAATGMGAVLLLANEKQAYTLTDRGTYLAFKDRINLEILSQGDPELHNPYHAIAINPEKHTSINNKLAEQYIAFLTSETAKNIINNYSLHGQQLFHAGSFKQHEVVDQAISQEVHKAKKGFFLNAIISSVTLIANFDQTLFLVVWTSLKVSLIAVLIAGLISLPLGVVVALNNFFGKNLLCSCLNTLMALPTVVVGLLLYGLLNRQGLLGDMGLLYTPTAMVIGQCVLIMPIIWNLCIAAVNGADPRLARTCSSLGANQLQRCLIYMSEVRFALVAAIVVGFGRAIGEVGIAMMLGGNIHGYTRTMTTAIALETSKGEFEFALALGLMLLLVAFIVNAILHQFQIKSK